MLKRKPKDKCVRHKQYTCEKCDSNVFRLFDAGPNSWFGIHIVCWICGHDKHIGE